MTLHELERQYREAAASNPGHFSTFEIFARLCLLRHQYQFADDALHEAIFRYPLPDGPEVNELRRLKAFAAQQLEAQGIQRQPRPLTDDLSLIHLSAFCPELGQGRGLPSERELDLARISLAHDARQCKAEFEAFLSRHDLRLLQASEIRMLPLIAKTLDPLIAGVATPPIYWPLLAGVWKKTFVENSQHAATLRQVLTLFGAQGIGCCVLKGIDYAARFYGGLAYRPMSDLDLLIDQDHVDHAHTVLLQAGWVTSESPDEHRKQFHYASSYRHFSGGAIDLHWRACEDLVQEDHDPRDLGPWQSTELLGLRWNSLNPSAALFVTILHGLYWNHLSPVRWVIDAALILRPTDASVSWPEIARLSGKYRVREVVRFALSYLQGHRLAAISDETLALFESGPSSQRADDAKRELDIRLRPEDERADVLDVDLLIEKWHSKFPSLDLQQFVVCGGRKPAAQEEACRQRGIGYSPECSGESIRRDCSEQVRRLPLLVVIDATTSRTVRLYR